MSAERDSICAVQARMVVFQVAFLESVVHEIDILATPTDNFKIIVLEKIKNNSIGSNIGLSDNEIQMVELEGSNASRLKTSNCR